MFSWWPKSPWCPLSSLIFFWFFFSSSFIAFSPVLLASYFPCWFPCAQPLFISRLKLLMVYGVATATTSLPPTTAQPGLNVSKAIHHLHTSCRCAAETGCMIFMPLPLMIVSPVELFLVAVQCGGTLVSKQPASALQKFNRPCVLIKSCLRFLYQRRKLHTVHKEQKGPYIHSALCWWRRQRVFKPLQFQKWTATRRKTLEPAAAVDILLLAVELERGDFSHGSFSPFFVQPFLILMPSSSCKTAQRHPFFSFLFLNEGIIWTWTQGTREG